MKNPFKFRYKKSYHEFFFWFGINYRFTILKLERNTWYHVYSIIILGITVYKKYDHEAYLKEVERFKRENYGI